MTVYLFPGQGSQRLGMGAGLFDAFPALTEEADDVLGYSVRSLCLAGSQELLDDTRYTQPAMFVVNALSYLKRIEAGRSAPAAMAGHSLGEYNALCAAGCIGFGEALTLVKIRGELMSQADGGAMAAIMGVDAGAIQACLMRNGLPGIDVANYNSPLQTVISGLKDDIWRAETVLAGIGATFVPLRISAAFHSRYMNPLQMAFREHLAGFSFAAPAVPVISNVYAQPHDPSQIACTLAKHLTHPVKWIQSLQHLFDRGERDFEELGPGDVLTKLVARNLAHYEAVDATKTLLRPADLDGRPEHRPAQVQAKPLQDTRGAHTARARIDAWNRDHPIGVLVQIRGGEGDLATRSPATVLFGDRAVIYVVGYRGYFALEDVSPITEA